MKKGTKLYWPNGELWLTKLDSNEFGWWGKNGLISRTNSDGKYMHWTDFQMKERYEPLGFKFVPPTDLVT